MRQLICILLLLCLPLQSFALPGGSLLFVSANGNGMSHALEHDEGIQHHHHDDNGSVHYDDSDESLQHIHDHSSSPQLAFLAVQFQPIAPVLSAPAVDGGVTQFIPAPFLDAPLRPPAPSLG